MRPIRATLRFLFSDFRTIEQVYFRSNFSFQGKFCENVEHVCLFRKLNVLPMPQKNLTRAVEIIDPIMWYSDPTLPIAIASIRVAFTQSVFRARLGRLIIHNNLFFSK